MKAGPITYVDLILEGEPVAEFFQDVQLQVENTVEGMQELISQLEAMKSKTVDLGRYVDKFDGQLLYLRLNLGSLRKAVTEAAAPIGALLLPVVNRAIQGLAEFAGKVGLVVATVAEMLTGYDSAAAGAEHATAAQNRYTAAVRAARRTLADFDQLQRLSGASGSGSTSGESAAAEAKPVALSPQLLAAAAELRKLLQPLLTIDFTPLRTALSQLGESWSIVWQQIGNLLQWLWYEQLTPMLSWVIQELAPQLGTHLAGALELLSATLEPVFAGLQALWTALRPVTEFIGSVLIGVLAGLGEGFRTVAQVISEKGTSITLVFQNIGRVITDFWELVAPVLEFLRNAFQSTFSIISRLVADTTGALLDSLKGVLAFLKGIFTGDWKMVVTGVTNIIRGMVNSVVGLLNSMLSGVVQALNAVIRAANQIRFTLPEWVPGLGGKTFGLYFKTVQTPQIPYLARGAVLPANKPFLAMVGDQRHGTNVEAPLATIQQAVAQVTAGQNNAVLAALQASVSVQQELLQAVLGIQIGDDTIARAVDRYNRKMAAVYGTGG